uniref:Uncharacterized protein n=1 Tax=Arundo donax TaxID=35708 RepID=A0A0A8YK09_ARUDO
MLVWFIKRFMLLLPLGNGCLVINSLYKVVSFTVCYSDVYGMSILVYMFRS